MSILNDQLTTDKHIIFNGQTYHLEFLETKHKQFSHQQSSMLTQVTTTSACCTLQPPEFPNLTYQQNFNQNPQQISDKILPQNRPTQIPALNLDMDKIMAEIKIDNFDDLLILDGLDFPQPNTSSCNFTAGELHQFQGDQKLETSRIGEQTALIETCITQQRSKEPLLMTSARKDEKSKEKPIMLKRHNTDMPLHLTQFIVSQDYSKATVVQNQDTSQINQISLVNSLKCQISDKNKEVTKLKDTLSRISQCLAKIYSSPQLLSKDIEDQELIQILSQGFMSQAKLHLAFLFSSPLIIKYKDEYSNELKSQTIIAIDHEKEFNGVLESFKATGNQIRYRQIPATLDNLRVSLTENPIALHFSGHGIENNKENFGKDSIILKDEGNFLVIEDNEGCAQFLSEKRLHELLEASGTKLEFVFVASCYSQFAGEIFHNAGAKHVICVRKGFQISDNASIIFSKAFYHALFSQTVTVCQAFEIAKAALSAEKDKSLAEEAKKFVLLKDSDEIERTMTLGSTLMLPFVPTFRPKKHKCTVFGPFVKGHSQNVGIEPMFRIETSKVEDFLGRRKEMQAIISDILQNRLVTVKGIPGIGKTTLVKAISYFLDERQTFKDGIILLSLRGLDQANMILTRLQLIISQHIPNHDEKKDDKALESFMQIQERIIKFMKDKEVLLVLDNAEDTLKKDGNYFREIIQNLLVNCPKLKMLLTSRYPIGHFADISEKLYILKELTPNFAIELLLKKAMRPIPEKEIQELLQSAEPARVLHYNPLRSKKDLQRLDEHHMFILLGGHPHAISLAAPLLQDKTLKELYALLNSNEIMDWLRIEGIEGTPLASLKVSLDTSIQHMSIQEPQAIKLFCMIGLLPGGCTDEDLNLLWGEGWLSLADKLLRASLLVKKNLASGENIYSLFPFMNQYAVSLMSDEDKIMEHRRICKYYAKICKELLKCTSMELKLNKLVQYETNIWGCIYRMIDKQTNTYVPEKDSVVSRAKSPGIPQTLMASSQLTDTFGITVSNAFIKSQNEDSELSDPVIDPTSEDYYDTILSSRMEENKRSRSEKIIKQNMRGLDKMQERMIHKVVVQHNKRADVVEDEEVKTEESQEYEEEEQKSQELCGDNEKLQYQVQKKSPYTQPQSLIQSQNYDSNFSKNHEIGLSEQIDHRIFQSEQDIYPTKSMANMLSDDQISFLQSTTQNLKKLVQTILKQDTRSKINEESLYINEESSDPFQRVHNTSRNWQSQQSNEDSENQVRNISNSQENSATTPCNQQNTVTNSSSSNSQIPVQQSALSYSRLQLLPYTQHFPQNFEGGDTSFIQFEQEQFETSSIDSLQNQLINMNTLNHTYSQESFFTAPKEKIRRQSKAAQNAYSNLQQVDELVEESSIMQMDEENKEQCCDIIQDNILNEIQEEFTDEPNFLKKLSSKKYHEDMQREQNQNHNNLEIQSSQQQEIYINDNFPGMDGEQNKIDQNKRKKGHQKRVTIQEGQPQQIEYKKEKPQSQHQLQKITPIIYEPIQTLTADGSLLVYYITNLITLSKYDDALKAIEQFGLKTSDQICLANLKKMQAYILNESVNNPKEVILKYEESLKLFTNLKIIQGQALCNCAIGFILYQQSSQFIAKNVNENKVFKSAMKKLEDAAAQYNKINHYYGESFCHKFLQFIKQKLGENCMDHKRKQKNLMAKVNKLQQAGKSNFIQYQGVFLGNLEAASLFLEIVHSEDIIQPQIKEQQLKQIQFQVSPQSTQAQIQQKLKKERMKSQEEQKQNSNNPHTANIQNVKKTSTIKNDNIEKKTLQVETIRKSELEIVDEYVSSRPSIKVHKPTEVTKKREAPKTQKIFNGQIASKINKELQQSSRQEDLTASQNIKHNLVVSSDNEQLSLRNKEAKKKVDLKEMGQMQVQKYKNARKEQISKKQLNSSSFIGGSQDLTASQNNGTNSRRSTLQKKKNLEVSSSQANLKSKESLKSIIQQSNQDDMIFEKALDVESGNGSADEIPQRDSVVGLNESTYIVNNQYLKPNGSNVQRPSTSMGLSSSKEKNDSMKTKRTTVESKIKPPTQTRKQTQDMQQQMLTQSVTSEAQSRKESPNSQQKKATASVFPQSQTVTTQSIKSKFMEVNITTTTTVQIVETMPQVIVDQITKPQILIESIDNDNDVQQIE